MKDIAIALDRVNVRYGDNIALADATLQIPYHSFTGVIGMNGAGKSTLFKAIMGLVAPTTGSITICGDDPKTAQKHGHVAYVPQSELVDWDFPISVYEVVMMGRLGTQNIFKTASAADHAAVQQGLERVNMTTFKERQIGELSGGQKKRVFIARALAQGADILLLDEPFAGLDATTEKSLIALLMSLQESGKTIILATHDLLSLPATCDHVALVKSTIIGFGPTKEVFVRELVEKTFDGALNHVTFK
ncbi:MAG TPA: metal ABC transporter ATP-binding protein [Candidatus Paceibacterota bacterium]|nr:metal ABC transporter ATP-binding protein [Candidatus Paceibacterota bacterium]HMO82586.1 metal ABC transporter ATP-binding protein [Candidatus Paceibacterota bacterium]